MIDEIDQMIEELQTRFKQIQTSGRHTQKARTIALDCLKCTSATEGSDFDLGLGLIALQYRAEVENPKKLDIPFGPLISELHDLAATFDLLASKIKHMNPGAIYWVSSTWGDEDGTEAHEKVCSLRKQGGAGPEVFPTLAGASTPLVERHEALAELMRLLARQAEEASEGTPRARVILDGETAEHALFRGVGQVLGDRGHSLRYMRPIASAIYAWVHGHQPAGSWAQWDERQVRQELREFIVPDRGAQDVPVSDENSYKQPEKL